MWTVFHFLEEVGLTDARHWWALQNIQDSSQPVFQTTDKEAAIKLATLLNAEAIRFGGVRVETPLVAESKSQRPKPVVATEGFPSDVLALQEELALAVKRLDVVTRLSPEDIGRIMHQSWTATKRGQGYHHPDEAGHGVTSHPCPKCHADLVPWERLPERQKDINRNSFNAVFMEIERRMNDVR